MNHGAGIIGRLAQLLSALASRAVAVWLSVNFAVAVLQIWGWFSMWTGLGQFLTPASVSGPGGKLFLLCALCPFSKLLAPPRAPRSPSPASLSPPGLWGGKLGLLIRYGVGGKHSVRPNTNTLQLFSIILGVSSLRNIFLGVYHCNEFQLAESYFLAPEIINLQICSQGQKPDPGHLNHRLKFLVEADFLMNYKVKRLYATGKKNPELHCLPANVRGGCIFWCDSVLLKVVIITHIYWYFSCARHKH